MAHYTTLDHMNTLTAILIDDESSSRNSLLQKLRDNCPEIHIVAECENGEEGIAAIESHKPDIVFLDVEMPRMNGFVMLQKLIYRNFELIFTTAYDHYAIQAIRCSALDYLVKPIEVKTLLEAIEKAKLRRRSDTAGQRIENLIHNLVEDKNQPRRIGIPSQEEVEFVDIPDIIYLEAESNYTSIYVIPDKKLFVSKTLKEFEELLPPTTFIRIHHSYLINKQHVHKYLRGEGGQVIMRNGKCLDVSRRKKEEFLRAIRT